MNNSNYFGPPRYYYKVKPGGTFDEGTIAQLIDDYSNGTERGGVCSSCGQVPEKCGRGLFEGFQNGDHVQKVCPMCEFEEAESLVEERNKDLVLKQISDLVAEFIYYGRKAGCLFNPPDRESFRELIRSGYLTTDEIINSFKNELEESLKNYRL